MLEPDGGRVAGAVRHRPGCAAGLAFELVEGAAKLGRVTGARKARGLRRPDGFHDGR